MSDNESEHNKYSKDPRIACKYGSTCYQKNPNHHKKYKHPGHNGKQSLGHINKKIKVQNRNKETEEVSTSNDISDSDENNENADASSPDEKSDADENTKSDQIDESEMIHRNSKRLSNEKPELKPVPDENNEDANASSLDNKYKISNDVSDSESDAEENSKCDQIDESKGVDKNNKRLSNEKPKLSVNNDVSSSDNSNDGQSKVSDQKTNTAGDNNPSHKTDLKTECVESCYKKFIKEKFLVDMPDDFYQFWEYCKKLYPKNPLEALKDIGLKLVGPYDVIAGRFDKITKSDEEYLLHWRYYHDPPEFQTVLKGDDKTGFHIGYFRDSPEDLPTILASNNAKKDGVLHQMGGNIFAALNVYLEDLKKTGDPFKKMHVNRIQTSIKKEAENLKLDLSLKTSKIISREKRVVSRTFSKIGLVVPYNRKTQLGYRELAMGNKDLATLFTKLQNALPEQKNKYLSELQPVFTFANIAADECDFGTGIELGWNIISHGVDSLNLTALRFLTTNYRLLNREAFAKIAEAHMKNRKKVPRGVSLIIRKNLKLLYFGDKDD